MLIITVKKLLLAGPREFWKWEAIGDVFNVSGVSFVAKRNRITIEHKNKNKNNRNNTNENNSHKLAPI